VGETPGYPRFKGRNRFKSFGFKEYGNGFKIDGRRLRMFGIGRVAVRWHRPLEGTIKTLRIKQKAGKWYAHFACEVDPQPLPATGKEIGLDVGLHHLLAASDNQVVENPRWYREEQARLRRIQRKVARRQRGSHRRRKAVLELQRQHERIQNRRKDFLRKLAYDLVQKYDLIVLENLQIRNMVRNHLLSKSILDAGWGYFSQHLAGKAEEAGRQMVFVDPAYTSKTCSGCGHVFEDLKLSHRWIECPCGLSVDRDVNASFNILHRAGHVRQALTYAIG
jgi:putative transposase